MKKFKWPKNIDPEKVVTIGVGPDDPNSEHPALEAYWKLRLIPRLAPDLAIAQKHKANEKRRIANLPNADKRHSIWREIAAQVRQDNPDLSQYAVATIVHRRLENSDNPEWRHALRSIDRISRII